MRVKSISRSLLGLGLVASANAVGVRRDEGSNDEASIIPKSFIVEYKSGIIAARGEASLAAREGVQVRKTFESSVFSGASIRAENIDVEDLAAMPEVARVWRNSLVSMAPTAPIESFDNAATAANYTIYATTGVDKVHAAGIFGDGVKIGIVDSGCQYTHPALGGGFGPGFKVAGGHDFVGDGYWPALGEKEPDEDPMDQLGHGTHVAGIIAGRNEFWTGVAPNASLYSYKVLSGVDQSDMETLVDAFLTAYEDGMDIITASIATIGGFSTNVWAEVASRIAAEGVVVTIAAGNTGDKGPFWASSGASGKDVLTVAALEADNSGAAPFLLSFIDGEVTNTTTSGYIPATDFLPSTVKDWPVVVMNPNSSDEADGCEPYPEGSPDLTGKVPLVRRGTCTFGTKLGHLEALGAETVLVYNNDAPLTSPYSDATGSLMGLISAKAGQTIIDAVQAGMNVTADFSIDPEQVVGIPNAIGGTPSIFTTWGALYDLTMKPEIAAPGALIFSTYPTDSYAIMSGTSMATPFVAGVAALYISAFGGRAGQEEPKDFAKSLHKRIMSSGASVAWSDGSSTEYNFSAPVAQVGNGLINAFKVMNYSTLLEFEKIQLNDTANFQGSHDVLVTNSGAEDVMYTLSVQDAAGFETLLGWDTSLRSPRVKTFDELEPAEMSIEVELPSPFTLGPGESKQVTVNFINPVNNGWNATALPLYSGKVILSGDNGEQLSIPYMGLGSDLKKEMKPVFNPGYPWSSSTVSAISIETKPYWSFNLSQQAQDFPRVYYMLKWGVTQVRWDIYESGWSEESWAYPPVPGENAYIGPATCYVKAQDGGWFNPSTGNASDTYTYPALDIERRGGEFWWFGKLGNGSQIVPGNYTMRLAALLPFGDPTVSDDWDIFEVPPISVLPCDGCPQLGS